MRGAKHFRTRFGSFFGSFFTFFKPFFASISTFFRGNFVLQTCRPKKISGLQTYPNLVGPSLAFLPRRGANLCRFVPVRSSQTRAWGTRSCACLLSVNSPALILSKNSGVSWAKSWLKFGKKLAKTWLESTKDRLELARIGETRLKLAKNRVKGRFLFHN